MWICSGWICWAKRPGKVVMVSNASEPQMRADLALQEEEWRDGPAVERGPGVQG